MTAPALLSDLAGQGVTLTLRGENIAVRPAERVTDELRAEIRALKPELMALISAQAGEVLDRTEPTRTGNSRFSLSPRQARIRELSKHASAQATRAAFRRLSDKMKGADPEERLEGALYLALSDSAIDPDAVLIAAGLSEPRPNIYPGANEERVGEYPGLGWEPCNQAARDNLAAMNAERSEGRNC